MNLDRGGWQISRVFSLLDRPITAKYHAEQYLAIFEGNNIGDFDIASVYEALTRRTSLSGDKGFSKYLKKAKESGEMIAKEDDRKYFLSELDTIN